MSIVIYFVGLMCTHLSAFRCASNIRKATSEHLLKLPLGYFDTHATGELRRIVDGCAASTETLLAHMLPDIAGATAMVAGLLVLLSPSIGAWARHALSRSSFRLAPWPP